jgi:glucan 1,3-beta-glucosidase
MEVAAAGFNFVRIPIGFWAIEKEEGEPFLQGVSWTSVHFFLLAPPLAYVRLNVLSEFPWRVDRYFLKAIEWARKYGLRINLDLCVVSLSPSTDRDTRY